MCMRSADSFPLLALKDYATATEVLCSWVRVRVRAQWAKVFLKSQLKVALYQKVRFVFQISLNLQKKYFKSLSCTWNSAHNSKPFIKFQAEDSDLEWFWKIWKTNLTFWKKPPLKNCQIKIYILTNMKVVFWNIYWFLRHDSREKEHSTLQG